MGRGKANGESQKSGQLELGADWPSMLGAEILAPSSFPGRRRGLIGAGIKFLAQWPYFARSHSTIVCGLLELHGPPGAGPGLGLGAGVGAGDRNVCAALQLVVVSPSVARARQ